MPKVSPPPLSDERRPGYRLHRLEVLNWGTFDRQVWKITPDGHTALVTGDIGSGKSTLLDGLTALLVPHQRIVYNKAAGATSNERSLKSYVLGAHAGQKVEHSHRAKSVYLRGEAEGLKHSVVLAYFFNESYGQGCTLAQVFWMESEEERQPEKLFLLAETDLSIKEHFSRIADLREFKKRLRDGHKVEFFESFKAYADRFRRLFGMDEEEALDLFYQTVSMKQVENLTGFVRTHMLPKANVEEEIKGLVEKFRDLEGSYKKVQEAKNQLALLEPISAGLAEYEAALTEIRYLDDVHDAIPAFFAFEKSKFLQTDLQVSYDDYRAAEANETALADELRALRERQQALKLDRENSEAGRRLAWIEGETTRKTEQLAEAQRQAAIFQKACETLGLNPGLRDEAFAEIRRSLDGREADTERRLARNQQTRDELVPEKAEAENRKTRLLTDIASLRQRRSQIPTEYLDLRQHLLDQTGLDEADLPFAGELLRVAEGQERWEMAIETRLRGLGLSLLVGERDYPAVSRCVDRMRLEKTRALEYLRMAPFEERPRRPGDASLFWKLVIHDDTPHHDWLERWLTQNHDLTCCETIEEFNRTPSAITLSGQVRQGKVRHRKPRPLTRRDYVLGWDNRAQLRLLEDDLAALDRELAGFSDRMKGLDAEQKNLSAQQKAIDELRRFRAFAEIDFPGIARSLEQLRREKDEISGQSAELRRLDEKLAELDQQIRRGEKESRELNQRLGKHKSEVRLLANSLYEALNLLGALDRDEDLLESLFDEENFIASVETWLRSLKKLHVSDDVVDAETRRFIRERLLPGLDLSAQSLNRLNGLEKETQLRIVGRDGLRDKTQVRSAKLRSDVERRMADFKREYPVETRDFAPSVEPAAARDFTELLDRLRTDDLPRFEAKFREDLRVGTIQNVTLFKARLERQEGEILKKIQRINERLRELPYDKAADTFIRIEAEKLLNDQELREFQADLLRATTNVLAETGADPARKYEDVRVLLARFMSGDEADKRWTARVTDVREWYSFGASERYAAAPDERRDYYSDSSGKSGGQKEKLAYTILASAIAYQYGLGVWEGTPRTFRLVVIDEAFGRGSEDSTRYGLDLFARMGLQLLVVTPLQKIAILEDYVQSVHFVANPTGRASSITNLSLAEFRRRKGELGA
jgi:uncharacterized protein YPO0396